MQSLKKTGDSPSQGQKTGTVPGKRERLVTQSKGFTEFAVLWPQSEKKGQVYCFFLMCAYAVAIIKTYCLIWHPLTLNPLCVGRFDFLYPFLWLCRKQKVRDNLCDCERVFLTLLFYYHLKILHQISQFKHNPSTTTPLFKKCTLFGPFWNESYLIKKQWESTDSIP